MVEGLLKEYPNVLVLRVRMPIVADLTYARNFITKIIKYDKVSQHTRQSNICCGSGAWPCHLLQSLLARRADIAHDCLTETACPAAGH